MPRKLGIRPCDTCGSIYANTRVSVHASAKRALKRDNSCRDSVRDSRLKHPLRFQRATQFLRTSKRKLEVLFFFLNGVLYFRISARSNKIRICNLHT